MVLSFINLKLCYMNYVQRLELWGDRHHPKWLDLLRIALGIFLCLKGIEFATNMGTVMSLMTGTMPTLWAAFFWQWGYSPVSPV
jgi:hypothetical protein